MKKPRRGRHTGAREFDRPPCVDQSRELAQRDVFGQGVDEFACLFTLSMAWRYIGGQVRSNLCGSDGRQ